MPQVSQKPKVILLQTPLDIPLTKSLPSTPSQQPMDTPTVQASSNLLMPWPVEQTQTPMVTGPSGQTEILTGPELISEIIKHPTLDIFLDRDPHAQPYSDEEL